MSELKTVLVELIKDSTAHGFPKIFKNPRIFMKILWALFTLGAIGACAYFIILALTGYFEYNVTTVIRMQSKIPLEFPAVTICNSNPFITNISDSFLNDLLLNKNGVEPKFLFTNYSYQVSPLVSLFDYSNKINALNKNITDDLRKSFGNKIQEFLFKCVYAGRMCTPSDFVWSYDVLHGNCFTFNSGKNAFDENVPIVKQSKAGALDGLQIEILNRFNETFLNLQGSKGFFIQITDQNSRPSSFQGIEIQTNMRTNILINKVLNSQIESPYSDCIADLSAFDSDIFKATVNHFKTYSRSNCYIACFQDFTIKNCNCSDPNAPYLYDSDLCLTSQQIKCEFEKYQIFFLDKNVADECSSYCPLECERTFYGYTTSFQNFPTDSYANLLLKLELANNPNSTLSLEDLKKNIASVNIFYDNLEYQTIQEQKQTTIADVVSNVGGLVGLFLGTSFLSFVEILEILFEIIFYFFEKKHKKPFSNSNKVQKF